MHKERRSKAWESTVRKSQQALSLSSRRGRSFLFGSAAASMSVVPTDDTTSETSTSSSGDPSSDRHLPNGDFYSGEWSHGLPHGRGRYLWADGCAFSGDWAHGKIHGHGTFTWPTGSTYSGDFNSGFIHGSGDLVSPSGDSYSGEWSMNLKHGSGTKNYSNGDSYSGSWASGLQEGHGRYKWRNGTEYVGDWSAGVIHGRGSMIWPNGNRYDGGWQNGAPSGSGSFRWGDGSLYIGIWNDDNGENKGIYYPSATATTPTARDPHSIFKSELLECKVCPGDEDLSLLPSQKAMSWPKGSNAPKPRRRGSVDVGATISKRGYEKICIWETDGDITCDIVDGNAVMAGGGRASADDVLEMKFEEKTMPVRSMTRAAKKQGETISKGHKNYELMLNLQLGIRHAVGRQAAQAATLDLKSSAFDPKEKIWTKFPPEGTKYTPPHQSSDFRWKDYCPMVFRTLRRLFKVDAADYMLSLCGDDALRELSSPGKSGSFFYLTNDDRYMIKTMKKAEVKVLLRMLPAYYKHVRTFENTLVTKFFGLHCVKLTGAAQKKVRFVIMGNLFCSTYHIHRRFDLKGSSHGRTTSKPESEIDENTTLKDLDLNFIFRLQQSWFQEFCRQVDKDCEFLEQERIMDYSLLVGVHFKDLCRETTPGNPRRGTDSDTTRTLRLGIAMPARVEQTVRRTDGEPQLIGDPTGIFSEVVLFFGIIDILQDYDISKKLEHAYKSIQHDPTSISAVDPRQYSRRFKDFIYKAFAEDT